MKRILVIIGVFVIAIATVLIILRQQLPVQNSSAKLQVAASFYPLYFFSQQIGGDRANVINITPAGAEPHDYEPTAQEIAEIEKSQLLILNGGGLEAWGDNIKQNLNNQNTIIVIVGEGLTTQQVMENNQNIIDPHIWLSPVLAKQIVDKITQGFIRVDSASSSYYQANANALKAKLDQLDDAYKQGLASCVQKNIVTSHAAFGYLATAYGLHQVSIAGLSPDAEPSPRQLGEIANFTKSHNIKYIFFESLVSPKLSQTIANEVGATTLVLNPIEGLNNEEVAQGKNYFTEMQNNLLNLQIALQCKK